MAERDRTKLPMFFPPFGGKIGTTYQDSQGEWPALPKAPDGAPNVVIILPVDVGFGQVSTYGGPVPTPNLDKLAANGRRYNRFHTTAICGPSRAALITGRNHHNCGSGFIGRFGIDTFGVGCDTGSPVCNAYKPPFTFTGEIEKVDILLGDAGLSEEEERQMQERYHAGVNY